MGLVDHEQGAGLPADLPERLVVSRVGEDDADIGERRLRQDARDVAGSQSGFESGEIVELHHLGGRGRMDLRADVGFAQFGLPAQAHGGEGLVHRAVVAPVEHQDLRPAGEIPRDPKDETVSVGGGERQLPQRQPEATGKLACHPDGVLGGQHGRDALPRPFGQHVGHEGEGVAAGGQAARRGALGVVAAGEGVAGHGTGVAQGEVDVLDAVHVGDARACRRFHEHREASGPAGHPGHGHTGEEVLLGLLGEPRGLRMDLLEAPALLGEAHAKQVTIDGGHGAPRWVVLCRGDVSGWGEWL